MHIKFLAVGGGGFGICILRGVGILWMFFDALGVLCLG